MSTIDLSAHSIELYKPDRCKGCRNKRKQNYPEARLLERKDRRKECPFFSCFSMTTEVNKPIDVLLILEGHGGGHNWDKIDDDLVSQNKEMRDFYLESKQDGVPMDEKYQYWSYHQKEIKILLDSLSNLQLSWVLTDFNKCYVDKKKKKNHNLAAQYCSEYLIEQINTFSPSIIILFGGDVQSWYKKWVMNDLELKPEVIKSKFPSQSSANSWVKQGGIEYIIENIMLADCIPSPAP